MGMSKNINTYLDVREVLDATVDALRHEPLVRYRLPTGGLAQNWMQRAYSFRKLAQAQANEELGIPGRTASTPYDLLVFKRDDDCILISLRAPAGVLETVKGKPIKPQATRRDAPDDELLDISAALMKDLGLETD